MHRFFLPSEAFYGAPDEGLPTNVAFPGPLAHQLKNVLRLRPGMRVTALDNSGWEYEVELVDLQGGSASARVCERRVASTEPRVSLILYQGVVKGQRFEWVLQKGTELGVSVFVPTETRRTIARPTEAGLGKRWASKRGRWETIIREAAEQSGRGRLPRLAEPLSFADACREAAVCDLALIPAVKVSSLCRDAQDRPGPGLGDALPREKGAPEGLAGVLRAFDVPPQSIALLIGPEGGFEEQEVALAQRCGIRAVTLGPRILRAETAALAAATIVLSELGEMA